MAYFILAFLAGLGISLQAAINTRLGIGLGNEIGGQPIMAALISFAVGTLCLLVVALFIGDWQALSNNIGQQSWWRWLGGALGALFVFLSVFLAPKIGITQTMFLFILGQLTMGMLIDSFGLIQMPVRPVYWWKFAGLGLMVTGLILFMFGEKWFK